MTLKVGTTSACAENTFAVSPMPHTHGNYLRVRGEYKPFCAPDKPGVELPPRARRIRKLYGVCLPLKGTTSACAENTIARNRRPPAYGNYLRVRGEYIWPQPTGSCTSELPPRARRIQVTVAMYSGRHGTTSACAENTRNPADEKPIKGTTSACAENTCRLGQSWSWRGNYLRVRGEYAQRLLAIP